MGGEWELSHEFMHELIPCSLCVHGADAVGLNGALSVQRSSSSLHPSGYIATIEIVLPVRKATSISCWSLACPQQSSSSLSGMVGNNS